VQGVYQVQSGQPLSFQPGSLATSGTTSPLHLGTNPVDSARGRSGYKRSISAGDWFNTTKLGPDYQRDRDVRQGAQCCPQPVPGANLSVWSVHPLLTWPARKQVK
jgi:hypothetical protein